MTSDSLSDNRQKDQDSRLPDYALKISRVFIHICLFIPLIIILRLKLDTFNSEERGTAEEEPMYQWSLTSNLRREIGKKTVYQYGGSWKIWMYFSANFVYDEVGSWSKNANILSFVDCPPNLVGCHLENTIMILYRKMGQCITIICSALLVLLLKIQNT